MSKPMPAHHREILIPSYTVKDTYDGARALGRAGPGKWTIVAASGATTDEEREKGWIRVIVAPARGPS